MVKGKRAGELRQSKKDKDAAAAAAAAEKQMDAGDVPAEQQADHGQPKSHNEMSETDLYRLVAVELKPQLLAKKGALDEANRAKNEASGEYRSMRRTFIKDYGDKAIKIYDKIMEFEKPGGEEALKIDLAITHMVAKFKASPIGAQMSWLDAYREPIEDEARRLGVSHELENHGFDPVNYAQGSMALAAYEKGYYDSQEERLRAMKPPTEPPPIGDAPPTHTHTDAEQKAEAEWPVDGQPPMPRTEQQAAE